MSLQTKILTLASKRPSRGITVGEAFDRLQDNGTVRADEYNYEAVYASVRARVYELELKGWLVVAGKRKDNYSGREQQVYKVPTFNHAEY